MIISLPNHLTGFVNIDRISDQLSQKVSKYAAGDVAGADSSPDQIPSLKTIYKAGEVLACHVVNIEGNGSVDDKATGSKGRKKRIELSIHPNKRDLSSAMAFQSLSEDRDDSLVAGMAVPGQVVSREDRGWTIDLGSGKLGFLPFASLSSANAPATSLSGISVGKTILTVVNAAPSKKSSRAIQLGPLLPFDPTTKHLPSTFSIESATVGSVVMAQVVKVGEMELEVTFGGGHVGHVDHLQVNDIDLNISRKDAQEMTLKDRFSIGQKLPARVIYADLSNEKSFLLSLKQVGDVNNVNSRWPLGSIIPSAEIVQVIPRLGILLSLNDPNVKHASKSGVKETTKSSGSSKGDSANSSASDSAILAFAHISRLSDDHIARIEAPYRVGSKHDCRLVDFDWFSGCFQASLQPSLLAQPALRYENLALGQIIRGVVMKKESFGLLVQLTDHLRGVCPVAQLTETGSTAALEKISVGQKFKFRILECEPASRRVTLTRKTGLLTSNLPILSSFADARIGETYTGYIAALKEFGAIVRFYGDIKGLVLVGEMADEFVEKPQELYFIGQVVQVRIIKCDPEKKELLLSLRKSTEKKKPTSKDAKQLSKATEPVKTDKISKKGEKRKHEETDQVPVKMQILDTKSELPSAKDNHDTIVPEMMTLDDFVVESEGEPSKQALPKPEPKPLLADKKLINGSVTLKEISEEFEKRLLTRPNQSVIWVEYISTLLMAGEVDMARGLAERALTTLSFRCETERLAIWSAYLGLEHGFGTVATLEAVFNRALVAADPRTIYMQLAKVYEDETFKPSPQQQLAKLYETMTNKFGGSCKVWIAYLMWMYRRNQIVEGRKLQTKALKALPKRKHVKATCKVAQLEYKYGSIERGRTLFEAILANNPKRLDIWSIYLTMEENIISPNLADQEQEQQRVFVRRLFERVIYQKQSLKKAKFLFKRFLEFERARGDQAGVERVKELARKYVENKFHTTNI